MILAPTLLHAAACAVLAALLTLLTWSAWRQRLPRTTLLLVLVLDSWTAALLIPDFLSQRITLHAHSLQLRAGRWFSPQQVRVDLTAIETVYEVRDHAHWLQWDRYWVFQRHDFQRSRVGLPELALLRREDLLQALAEQGIQVRPAPDLAAAAARLNPATN